MWPRQRYALPGLGGSRRTPVRLEQARLRTLRVTPAIAAGVVDRVFTIEDFHDAITAEVEPVAKPEKKALTHRAPPPETTARALPNGRGFLRALPGGGGPKGPGLAPAPGPRPPAAPAAPAPALREAPQPRQLDLFEWHRPKDDHENQPE